MCKITVMLYTCRHRIEHTWSSCRGQKKVALDSIKPACRKPPTLSTHASHKCGPCSRADAEEDVYHKMGFTREQDLTEAQQTELDERLAEAISNIPTTNWRAPAPPVYGRRPSGSRSATRRSGSLLSQEVKAEDIGGPEAWESKVVPDSGDFVPVYETVCGGGWDSEWPSETKSLAEEIAEDSAERGTEVEDDQDQDDQDQDDQDQDGQDQDDQYQDDQDQEEDGQDGEGQADGELGVYEGDDLLLLAQQTPLPLDLEVYDNHNSECDPSSPATAVDTLMPTQSETISADAANPIHEIVLDNASSALTAENLRVLESYSQSAESPIEGNNTQWNTSRVTTPYARAWQLAGDSKLRYWYRQRKSCSPDSKPKVGCWELVSVASS
jgi:hypothetical protein